MKSNAFTLIELLVVIVIIGILSTISTATFSGYFAKARDAERTTAISQVANIMTLEGIDIPGDDRYFWGGAGFRAIMDKNGYNFPNAKNNLCYYVFAAFNDHDDSTSSLSDSISNNGLTQGGDNNEFIIATWGESTSTLDQGTAGPIFKGTQLATSLAKTNASTLTASNFECPERGNNTAVLTIGNQLRDGIFGYGSEISDKSLTVIVGPAAKPEDQLELIDDTEYLNLLVLS